MKPLPRFDSREADAEKEEADRWRCRSCDAPIDPDVAEYPGYCWHCGSYWKDRRNGLWEDE